MEKDISLFFSKLSPIQDKENYSIEISYNNNIKVIAYPQDTPLIISLSTKTEKQIIPITIKSKQISKKQKIFGIGEIIIYKKFLTEKPMEKYILLYKENKDKKNVKKYNNNIGKILVQIKLDELSSIQKIENENEKINEENNNINNDPIIKTKESEKDLLKLDENILQLNNIDEILSYKNIIELKDKIDNEEIILPKDIISLKLFNQNLFNQSKLLNEKYNKILSSLSESNQNLEKNLNDITEKNNKIEQEIKNLELDSIQKAQEINQKLIKLKQANPENKIQIKDINDIKDICNIIKSLESLGYKLSEGDLTDSEKQNLTDVLNKFSNEKKNCKLKEEILDENTLDQLKDDYELGEKVISLIERDVNDLFSRKLIEMVNIDQIDSISYVFSGKVKKKEISFKFDEKNNLICSTGEVFPVWLVKNFSL